MRCIYCLAQEPAATFKGREHVIPQAFGLFDTDNFVLKCVCDACNAYFGKTIDLKLARDSAEAVDRVSVGLKTAADFRSLGRRSTSRVQILEGPAAGGNGYLVAARDGSDRLGFTAFPQIWVSARKTGPYERFDASDLPTPDALTARGYVKGAPLFFRTVEIADPAALLRSKGYTVADSDVTVSEPPAGLHAVENVLRIAEPEMQAIAKIAFNYLAATAGYAKVLDSAFDAARTFIRYGRSRARLRVYPFYNSRFVGTKGHYVSLSEENSLVVAQLSLLMRLQYFVVLAEGDNLPRIPSVAHRFHLETRSIVEIEPLPISRGRPVTPRSSRPD